MKAWVVSDLHHDENEWLGILPPPEADIAIVAGDVTSDNWLVTVSKILPTLFVLGNHDFYKTVLNDRRDQMRRLSDEHPGLIFLDNSSVLIEGVRFFGGTLWTDFDKSNAKKMFDCQVRKGEFKHVRWSNDPYQKFTPRQALIEHKRTKRFIQQTLLDDNDKTVVMTHYAPSFKSVDPKFFTHPLNCAYASDLDDFINELGPDFWIHGHTHNSSDYTIGKTRMINNPRGYGNENPDFDPNLIITI